MADDQTIAFIKDESSLERALQALRTADPVVIGRMLEATGAPPLRARAPGLPGLVRIVVSQQVSTASAQAIFTRIESRFGDLHFAKFLHASDGDLRACGLSTPKMRTLRNIAAAVSEGALAFDELAQLEAGLVRARLTAIKGIGTWTADVYLLFCLGHADIWPAGDLALQEGVRLALRLRARPDARRMESLSLRWSPYRSAAARLVWAYYARMLALRREGAP